MFNSARAETADERSPWTQPGFLAAAAVVGIIVVLGVVLALTGGSDRTAQTPAPGAPAPATTTTRPVSADPDASVCGLPAGDQSVLSEPPATKWELVGKVAAPTAPDTIGPKVIEDGLRSCFAHSATGALYAAVNAIAMTASSTLRERFVRKLVVPGVGRDRSLEILREESGATDQDTSLQVAGFAITDSKKRSAVIDLAFHVDNASSAAFTHLELAMRWEDGDWKLSVPDTGQPFDGMERITSLAGYASWSGA